jgi:orotidine-5'-phosphate decarboxylase
MGNIMKTGKDFIIFPLDVSSPETAMGLVEGLAEAVGMFKVGLELFVRSGPDLVRRIVAAGSAKVFLDLKLHDIPVTVKRAMAQVADLGVEFATVHCGDSQAMLEAAVDGSAGRVKVLGVTVLTSVAAADVAEAGYRQRYSANLTDLVLKRAAMAKRSGCAGVVCSGDEVRQIKAALGGDFLTVTPGIRPRDLKVPEDDQSRIVTPAMAIARGADYLVIGRPIRDAADPLAAARAIAAEIRSAATRSDQPA